MSLASLSKEKVAQERLPALTYATLEGLFFFSWQVNEQNNIPCGGKRA